MIYCLKCMIGLGGEGNGPIMDMYLFPTIIEEKKAMAAVPKVA